MLYPYKSLAAILICITIWALIDCLKREEKHPRFWTLMIIFFGFFGAAVYFIKIRIERKTDQQ